MKVRMPADETDEGIPVGAYTARLTAIKEIEPSDAHPDWGSSYCWEFEVTEGPEKGHHPVCFTKTTPTTKNNLGKLLRGLLGRPVQPREEVDLSAFLNQTFTITVDWNQDGTRTRVKSATPLTARPEAAIAFLVTRPAAAPPPPRRPSSAPAAAASPPPPAQRRFYRANGDGEPVLMDEKELSEWIQTNHADPATLEVVLEGESEWKPAAEYGFKDEVPF